MNKTFFIIVGIIGLIGVSIHGGIRYVKSINLNINCTGHLERAANANTTDLAQTELTTAINYLESQGLTNGYTSILYRSPDEDIGYWYQNLKAAQNELFKVNKDTSALEKSNLLMKLRDTLTDQSSNGTSLIYPNGVSIYPNNVSYAFWGYTVYFLLIISFIVLFFLSAAY